MSFNIFEEILSSKALFPIPTNTFFLKISKTPKVINTFIKLFKTTCKTSSANKFMTGFFDGFSMNLFDFFKSVD